MSDFEEYFSYLNKRSTVGRLYRRYILYPNLSKRLSGKTLDIGCGIGDFLAFRSETTGVDINPYTVEYCKALGLDALVMQPDQLPFSAGSFDSVLLDNVLEHLDNPKVLLEEIRRVIKPSGLIIIGVPGRKGWNSDPDHKKYYDQESLKTCLIDSYYTIKEVFYMPLGKSSLLNKRMRQYCMYMVCGLF